MKYQFYHYTDKENKSETVVAISSYAQKPVKGIAKCSPEDHFSIQLGKELAMARCNTKVAAKRKARAKKCLLEASEKLSQAEKRFEDMCHYYQDAIKKHDLALKLEQDIVDKL